VALAAPGGWMRARLLRLRAGSGRASQMAAGLLARVGAHPSDFAASQASTPPQDYVCGCVLLCALWALTAATQAPTQLPIEVLCSSLRSGRR